MIELFCSVLAAGALLILAVAVLLMKKGQGQGWLGWTALLLAGIEIADRLALSGAAQSELSRRAATMLEAFLPAALLGYGLSFGRASVRRKTIRTLALLAAALLFPAAALLLPGRQFFYSPDFPVERVLFLGAAGYWFYLGITLSSVVALMNVEATFVSTCAADRGKIKFEVIGMSSLLAVLIFYFSQGLLYRTINANLLPVRSTVLCFAAGMALLSRLKSRGVRVTVSRYILYRSASLLAVGVYFLVLGLAGQGMQYFNVPLGGYLTVLLAFAGGIALLTALLSERIRRWLAVLVSKHFFAQKHDYRETWLGLTTRLAACRSRTDLEQAVPAAYCEIFGLRNAALYLLDPGSGGYAPAGKRDEGQVAFVPSQALLSYFRDRRRVWNPADGEYAPLPREAAFAAASRTRLVVPLVCNDEVEGLVLFGPGVNRDTFTFEDYDLMKIIARQSALLLSNLRLSEELIETREFAAMARISSFVMHDLKNLAYSLSLVLDNAGEHMENPEFQQDVRVTVRHTVDRMKRLIQKLKGVPRMEASRRQFQDISLLAREVLREFVKTRTHTAIAFRGDPAACLADGEELRSVIVNLVQNGIDAAGEHGTVTVETGTDKDRAFLRVSDTGCGMSREFIRQRLFRPFQSTKPSGLGIGLYQCRRIVEGFGGALEATSENGKGAVFTVLLPLSPPPVQEHAGSPLLTGKPGATPYPVEREQEGTRVAKESIFP